MLFKRYLALTAGVLLFIVILIGYFDYAHSQIENRFAQERKNYGVENAVLTASNTTPTPPPSISSTPTSYAPAPAPTTPDSSSSPAPAPTAATPADTTAPAPATTPDTNIIIGPLPPSTTPSTPADPSSTPVPPPSTMDYPRENASPFIVMAAYHPFSVQAQTPGFEPPRVSVPAPAPTAAASEPAINMSASSLSSTNAAPALSSSSTNAAPFAAASESGAAKPVPVQASVIVLGYHQFMAPGASSTNIYKMRQDNFETEMKYLRDNGYHVVPLSDVVRFVKHEIGLPPNSVAITIDDGFKSSIVYAAPVLKKYGYPWTYFVYPQFITTGEGPGAASWKDLADLQADGVDIECHSMTHPILTKKGGKSPEQYDAWLTNETAGAKAILEQKLGKKVPFFAYPYGAYNKEVEAKTIAAGYEGIFTVADNPVHTTTNVYCIGRYIITQPVERNFAAYLHQGALGIADADPAPGATISNPRPVITAVLGYAGSLDAKSIETEVRDFGAVRHDYDPQTSTVRLYLPRDLVQPTVIVNIHVKDADTGQMMVANWHFNYEPGGAAAAVHAPIAGATNAAPVTVAPAAVTNAPATHAPEVAAPKSVPVPTTNVAPEMHPPAKAPVSAPVVPTTTPTPAPAAKNATSAARQGSKVD